MRLKRLSAYNFRNFKEINFETDSLINEIIGENGQGKTSVLEAIYICLTGSSFRTSCLQDLIKHNEKGFFVEVEFEKHDVLHVLAISYDGTKRRVFLNRNLCESSSSLLGLLHGVACTPQDHYLIKGSPANRRHFLDLQMAQCDPLYVHHLNRYSRALKQRNILLKQKNFQTMESWESELAISAAYITQERNKTISFLKPRSRMFYSYLLSGSHDVSKDILELIYETHAPVDASNEDLQKYFQAEYRKKRPQEAMYGATLVGPHRDDCSIVINDRKAKEFASEGQQRLAALALKFAEWHSVKDLSQVSPLMLVDDFGACLDSFRTASLFRACQQLGQVFTSSHTSCHLQKEETFNRSLFVASEGTLQKS